MEVNFIRGFRLVVHASWAGVLFWSFEELTLSWAEEELVSPCNALTGASSSCSNLFLFFSFFCISSLFHFPSYSFESIIFPPVYRHKSCIKDKKHWVTHNSTFLQRMHWVVVQFSWTCWSPSFPSHQRNVSPDLSWVLRSARPVKMS